MIVMKFGGAVLRNPEGFFRMAEILKKESSEEVLAVVSAFSTATRDLEKAAKVAEDGELSTAMDMLGAVIEKQKNFAEAVLLNAETKSALSTLLDDSRRRISDLFRGISITHELTPRTLDIILSFGEYFALHIVKHFLEEQGLPVACVDSTSVIVTDANYGNAVPNREKTLERVQKILLPKFTEKRILLIQGFVAQSVEGETTTMGRESSNLTATLLAELVKAREVVIWSDVRGIRSADPDYVEETKLITKLSYDEAHEAARSGLKLLYPTMIDPARRANIPILFRSAFHPDQNCSEIRDFPSEHPSMLILREKVYVTKIAAKDAVVHEEENFLARNFPDKNSIISLQYFPDSVCAVTTRLPRRRNIPEEDFTVEKNYSLVTVFNIPAARVFRALPKILSFYAEDMIILGLGTEPDIARFAFPREHTRDFLQVLHGLLLA